MMYAASKTIGFSNISRLTKSGYYHYLNVLCNEYIKGGEFAKTLSTIEKEIGETVGTEANAFNCDDINLQELGGI